MNDYLSNLSSRSFDLDGGIQLVRPRLPSLFEPSQGTWGVSVEAPSGSAVNHETYDHGPALSLPNASEEPMQVQQDFGKRKQAAELPAVDSNNSVQLYRCPTESFADAEDRAPLDNESSMMVLPQKEANVVTSIHSTAKTLDVELLTKELRSESKGKGQLRQKPVDSEKLSGTLHHVRNDSRPDSVRQKQVDRPAEPPNRSKEERLVVENVILKEHVKRIVDLDISSGAEAREQHNVISPPMVQPFQRPIEPILRPWKNPGHREDLAKPEPTIQVTIGRIEVRAVTAPVQSRPRPKAPASMTLDEYLRRPNGGGR